VITGKRAVRAILLIDRRVVLGRRKGGSFAGLLELPGGKIEKDEDIVSAMVCELEEELFIRPNVRYFGLFDNSFIGGWTTHVFDGTIDCAVIEPGAFNDKEFSEIVLMPLTYLFHLRLAFDHGFIISSYIRQCNEYI